VNTKEEQNKTEDKEDAEETLGGTQSNISSDKRSPQKFAETGQGMKLISDATHPPAYVGGNVIIPIPDLDRAKADLRHILGVVLDTNEDGLYKIGTKDGVVDKLYCR
jgi:hypothetical protein